MKSPSPEDERTEERHEFTPPEYRTPLEPGECRYLGYRPQIRAMIFAYRDPSGTPPSVIEDWIAAAPELLEAAKALVSAWDKTAADSWRASNQYSLTATEVALQQRYEPAAITALRAAIKKARGEE